MSENVNASFGGKLWAHLASESFGARAPKMPAAPTRRGKAAQRITGSEGDSPGCRAGEAAAYPRWELGGGSPPEPGAWKSGGLRAPAAGERQPSRYDMQWCQLIH